jgi:hypothetical protein
MELAVVATRFSDGNQLKVKTEYVSPQTEEPFEVKEEVKVIEPEKPAARRATSIETKEPVVITPQQDRYKNIGVQKREPAYVRHRATFDDETEQLPSTPFHPVIRDTSNDDMEGGNGSLF